MAEVQPTGTGAMTQTPEERAAADKRAKQQREDLAKKGEDIREQVKEGLANRDRINHETMARQDASHPTPTQEENDRARLGDVPDKLEYDGSPPQGSTAEEAAASAKAYGVSEDEAYVGGVRHRSAEGKPAGNYQTRAAHPKK